MEDLNEEPDKQQQDDHRGKAHILRNSHDNGVARCELTIRVMGVFKLVGTNRRNQVQEFLIIRHRCK